MQKVNVSVDNGKHASIMSPTKSPNRSKPKPRISPAIELCKCRDYVEGRTFVKGEKLEWPLLAKKIKRVFPRTSNPITPCDWGKEMIKQDPDGRVWAIHHLEIKECLPAPSITPIAPEHEPRVMICGESATKMSDALDSMMNMLDELPSDWKPKDELPIRVAHFPAFATYCSMCGFPRHDCKELHDIPENQTGHPLKCQNAISGHLSQADR